MGRLKNLTILGSTGSIGVSTLDVIGRHPEKYQVFALVAGLNTERLTSQILKFRPKIAVVATEKARARLTEELARSGLARSEWPELLEGAQGRVKAAAAAEADFVMSAIVGVAGLEATYEAVRRGKRVGLANKEVLVASGQIVMETARKAGAELIPVDSEHNGAHQCLRAGEKREVAKLLLTASGGPFREMPRQQMATVTPEQALNHPTWKMGRRITIDSATLMNKGFEVIEACWLFGLSTGQVEVVVHPQSTVHAMVEFSDGSIVAQISATDMRMPIQYALTYPGREEAPVPRIDWTQARSWQFFPPDFDKFPLLKLAYQAQEAAGSATCVLNAADEIAVEAFLNERISFPAIATVVEETLNHVSSRSCSSIQEVIEVDKEARGVARQLVSEPVVRA